MLRMIYGTGVAFYEGTDIGAGTQIGAPTEIHSTPQATITIGEHCDIASFVVINVSDSHLRCIGRRDEIVRKPIVLEDHVFVGSMAVILGGAHIGHHSVIAAGEVVRGCVPPWSLVVGGEIWQGYYSDNPEDWDAKVRRWRSNGPARQAEWRRSYGR